MFKRVKFKDRPYIKLFRQLVSEHDLTIIMYLKFPMADQVETGKVWRYKHIQTYY